MESEPSSIEMLLEEIRACRDCGVQPANTPVAYGTADSRILIVSEGPFENAWRGDLGKQWSEGFDVSGPSGGAARGFCRWLGILNGPFECLFWIQRANCWAGNRLGSVSPHCSGKYIRRAIRIVKPRVIVALGRTAAGWFLRFKKLSDVVGKEFTYREDGFECPLIPLFHPSGANRYLNRQPASMRGRIRELAGLPEI